MTTFIAHIKLKGTPPTTNNIYRHKGSITFMTAEGRATKEGYQWECKSQYHNKIIENPISVVVEFYFKDKLRRDLDNFLKIVLDSMTGILWKDDSQIIELTLRKFIDKENSRVELWVL